MKLLHVDADAYDTPGITKPASFLQTPFWADFKALRGWKPLYFILSDFAEINGTEHKVFLSVLVLRFSGFASLAYLPLGPDVQISGSENQAKFLSELSRQLAPYLPKNTLCIRYDPPWGTRNEAGCEEESSESKERVEAFPEIPGRPVQAAPAAVQPPDTVILDLSLSPEKLLENMKQKWRYNIRLGEKKGITVRYLENGEGTGEGIDTFYRIYLETAARDGIAIHSRDYYRDLFMKADAAHKQGKRCSVRAYIAEHEGTALASIITLFYGSSAVYLYGASSNEKRNLMSAYSLQWKAIQDAKEYGCAEYDFYGIPPRNDPSHPMFGLYRFKTGFGGAIIHREGSLDIALKPVLYSLYRIAEATRAFWFKKMVKLFRH